MKVYNFVCLDKDYLVFTLESETFLLKREKFAFVFVILFK